MSLKGIRLSPEDRTLLETKFLIDHPSAIGVVGGRILPGEAVVVESTYNIIAADDERNLWIDCGACGHKHNHKHGFIVRLSDDRRATLGKTCGKTKHDLEYREQIAEFETRRKRQRLLQGAVTAFGLHDQLIAGIDAVQRDAGARGLTDTSSSLAIRFPALVSMLRKHDNGRLYGLVRVRDYDAEAQRDARLDRKIEALAKRRNLSRDVPGTDAHLLAELAHDPDASKEPLTRVESMVRLRFAGACFLNLDRLVDRMVNLRYRAVRALDDVEDRESAACSDETLKRAVDKFVRAINDTIATYEMLVEARRFLESANVKKIIEYVNKSPKRRLRIGDCALDGSVLRVGSRGTSLDIRISELRLSVTQLEAMHFQITGSRRRSSSNHDAALLESTSEQSASPSRGATLSVSSARPFKKPRAGVQPTT